MTVGELFQKFAGVDPAAEVFVTPAGEDLVLVPGTVALVFDDNFDLVQVVS